MAATIEAVRLTEAHRLAQLRIGGQTVTQMLLAWPLLDPGDIDGTFSRWLQVVLAIIAGTRSTSARLAATYLSTFRVLELGVDAPPFVPRLAEAVPRQAVETSMVVTGPVALRGALGRGVLLAKAQETAQARSASAAMRHALNGGRDTIVGSVEADGQALGWARAASGRACAFCAMLASRGPAYSETGVGFEAHDHCACTAEPVYRHDAAWPAGSQQYRGLWDKAASGTDDPLNSFRRALTGG